MQDDIVEPNQIKISADYEIQNESGKNGRCVGDEAASIASQTGVERTGEEVLTNKMNEDIDVVTTEPRQLPSIDHYKIQPPVSPGKNSY